MLPSSVSLHDADALLTSWGHPSRLYFSKGDPLFASFGGGGSRAGRVDDSSDNSRRILIGAIGAQNGPASTSSGEMTLYVLDTSFLLEVTAADLSSMSSEANAAVVIPFTVLQELDGLIKAGVAERKRAAIEARNWLLWNAESDNPNVRFQSRSDVDPNFLVLPSTNDDHIVGCAVFVQRKDPTSKVILCTNDKMMTIKALSEKLAVKSSKPS